MALASPLRAPLPAFPDFRGAPPPASPAFPSLPDFDLAALGAALPAARPRADPAIAHGRRRRRAYAIESKLGCGTQGSVRLATCLEDGRQYALKVYEKPARMFPATAGQAAEDDEAEAYAERVLRRELRVCEIGTDHPHIVRLKESFTTERKHYFVYEFAAGGDLQDYLARAGGQLDEEEARSVVASIASAIAHLHTHGIVHRDIKPANVLIRDRLDVAGSLCLADFGSSFVEVDAPSTAPDSSPRGASPAESSLASSCSTPLGPLSPEANFLPATLPELMHSLAGTPFFLPPEMVRGAPYTASVDAWALGCTAYQILFGCTPFQKKAETLADLYAGIARAELEFPEDVEVSGAAKDFLSRLLDADAASRSTVTGALAHPWIADMLPAAADAEDDDACSVYSVESGVEVRFNELGELEVVDAGKRADSGVGWAEGEWGRYSPR